MPIGVASFHQRLCSLPFARSMRTRARHGGILGWMPAPLIEFPADDPDRARRFWRGVLGAELAPRPIESGSGWETEDDGLRLGADRAPLRRASDHDEAHGQQSRADRRKGLAHGLLLSRTSASDPRYRAGSVPSASPRDPPRRSLRLPVNLTV